MLVGHMFEELDREYSHSDAIMSTVARESENGRLFKLLSKLGMVSQRIFWRVASSYSPSASRSLRDAHDY
jgi:hypothetical protein